MEDTSKCSPDEDESETSEKTFALPERDRLKECPVEVTVSSFKKDTDETTEKDYGVIVTRYPRRDEHYPMEDEPCETEKEVRESRRGEKTERKTGDAMTFN